MTKMTIMFLLKKEVMKETKMNNKMTIKLPFNACPIKLKNTTNTIKYKNQELNNRFFNENFMDKMTGNKIIYI